MVTFAQNSNINSNIKKASCIPPKRKLKTIDTETSILLDKSNNHSITTKEKKTLKKKLIEMKKRHSVEEKEFMKSQRMARNNCNIIFQQFAIEQNRHNNLIAREAIFASTKIAEANTELAHATAELAHVARDTMAIMKEMFINLKK
jgi:hypothetical protein